MAKNRFHPSPRLIIPLIAVVILAGGWEGWQLYHRHQRQKQVVIPTSSSTSSSSTTSPSNASKTPNTTNNSSTPSTQQAAAQNDKSNTSGNQPLKAPWGNFVSNHHPSLSGSSSPSKEQSVCNTTPGASCTIQFTKDGFTKSLPSQVADSNGVVIWNWDVNGAGFTEGSWQIKAVATLNDQTASTADQLNLEVQP